MCEEPFPQRCVLFFSLFFFLSFLFLFCFEILEKCRETGERKPKPRGVPPKMRWFSKEPSNPVQWTSPVFLKLLCPPLVEFPMPACSGWAGGAEPPPHLPDAWPGRATEQGLGPLLAAALGRACTLAQPGSALQTNRVLFENKP